jgi:hypothetical protein
MSYSRPLIYDLCLSGKAEAGALGVENDILALEEDITEDREANARVALDTTVAGGAASGNRGVVDQLTGDNGIVAIDGYGKVGQGGGTGEDVATVGVAVLGAGDLPVVGGDKAAVEQEEGGAGV